MNWKQLTTTLLALWLLVSPSIAQESRLQVYGFFDLEAEASNKDAAGKKLTFDQHHLNIISIFNLDECFRIFSEIEWEHGPKHDPSSASGTIYLARAFLEYKHSDACQLRGGIFLPPFGLYNERHDATPTFISTILPQSIYGKHLNSVGGKDRLYAKIVTGFWGLGSVFVNNWGIEYHVYLSNGRGPRPAEKDNNANKGVGGRLVITPPSGHLRLGMSYYTDRDGNALDSKQSALAWDAEFEYEAFKLTSELFIPRGETADSTGALTGQFRQSLGGYVQGSVTLLERLTPFFRYDYFDNDVDKTKDAERIFTVGINYSISPKVYLKNELHFHRFGNPNSRGYELYIGSVAVAF